MAGRWALGVGGDGCHGTVAGGRSADVGMHAAQVSEMSTIHSYRDLEVWQRAMDFAVRCYAVTRSFPSDERFELTRQIRRAAVSVPSNIAEGFNRRARPAYINHLTIGLGSHGELDTQLELAARLGYVSEPTRLELRKEVETIGRLLSGLIRSLRQ